MNQKLRVGMAFEKRISKPRKIGVTSTTNPKIKKQLKLPKLDWKDIPLLEIFKSFCISVLVMFNAVLLILAIGWFALIFSFISPTELIHMYGVDPSQAETLDGSGEMEISDSTIRPAPALNSN